MLYVFSYLYFLTAVKWKGFSGGILPSGKESVCNSGDANLIPRLGTSPGEGNGSPLQYSCLGDPMDRGIWWTTVYGVTKESEMTE